MLVLNYSCDVNDLKLLDGNTAHFVGSLPDTLKSFLDATELSIWREHYHTFACILVDSRSSEVILIRDHLGVAPLYYQYMPGQVLRFGWSIPEVLKLLPSTPPFIDTQIAALFSEDAPYSDKTIYQGIKRVEPGHMMHFKSNGTVVKRAFWTLERTGSLIHYKEDQDYIDHFSTLMNESLHHATNKQQNIAAEFSAGLDSSAVYCCAIRNNIAPKLYMHVGNPGSESLKNYNERYEKAFIDYYQLNDIQRIDANNFDPIQIFKDYASWFAGPAPYLFSMFANPIHCAVAAGKHPILLSGFGGDQGVSGQIPLNFFMHDLIHQGEYQNAWLELAMTHSKKRIPFHQLRRILQLAQFMHPSLYAFSRLIKNIGRDISNSLRNKDDPGLPPLSHPYQKRCYRNVREAEWYLLQGPASNEIRMRIEYSSIVSKKMGFEYRYPLLYPKLLEFILRVPLKQKRHNGQGRYLIHRYLAQCLPTDIFATYRKQEGLGIVPSTFDLYKQKYYQGCYQNEFENLPYAHRIQHKNSLIELRRCIKGFMLKTGSLY